MGPIGCVRIGRVDGQWVINPTHEQKAKSDIDLLYAGLRGKFLMMEGSASEISDEDFIAALKRAHEEVEKIIDLQIEMRRALGKPDKDIHDVPQPQVMKQSATLNTGNSMKVVSIMSTT